LDYIREELLRQQAALAAVLLGEAAEETAGKDAPPPEERRGTAPAESAAGRTVPEAWAVLERGRRKSGGGAAEMTGLPVVPGGRELDIPWMKGVGAWGSTEDALEVGRERMVTEVFWADAGGTPGAKELSRAFQRDARRYDGGFPLY